jgi:hypothetical protein
MERKSTNDNFEHFLQQNAEDFRIHPSPKVWEGVYKNLNKRRRRFYFGFITLLISATLIGYTLFDLSLPVSSDNTPALPPVTESIKAPKQGTSNPAKTDNRPQKSDRLDTESEPVPNPASSLLTPANNGTSSVFNAPFVDQAIAEDQEPREKWAASLLTVPGSSTLNSFVPLANDLAVAGEAVTEQSTPDEEPGEAENTPASETPKARRKNSKFGLMFFFTPTISYRKLTENKSYLRSSQAYNFALYDINNAVTHKPDIGLELGLTTKYAITKNVKLRAGLQFNINRYDIKAFQYRPEIATIALNNGYSVDSLNTLSNYRNFNGGKTDWLQNFYFQVSAPVGLEIKLHGNDKMHIGVASTIQPTYVIGDRAYMITADYKNYAQVPWLIRHWNVNTNLETFVSYSTGKIKWQVGPQVRYQLLSSFVSEYPIKENLFDFGLKVGISLNQNQ